MWPVSTREFCWRESGKMPPPLYTQSQKIFVHWGTILSEVPSYILLSVGGVKNKNTVKANTAEVNSIR